MHRDVVHLAVCSNATGFLVTGSEDGHAIRQHMQSILVFGRGPGRAGACIIVHEIFCLLRQM